MAAAMLLALPELADRRRRRFSFSFSILLPPLPFAECDLSVRESSRTVGDSLGDAPPARMREMMDPLRGRLVCEPSSGVPVPAGVVGDRLFWLSEVVSMDRLDLDCRRRCPGKGSFSRGICSSDVVEDEA